MKLRRCYQCKHYRTWHISATWAYEEDWGWECKKNSEKVIQDRQELAMSHFGDEFDNLMQVAIKCPFYQNKNLIQIGVL